MSLFIRDWRQPTAADTVERLSQSLRWRYQYRSPITTKYRWQRWKILPHDLETIDPFVDEITVPTSLRLSYLGILNDNEPGALFLTPIEP